MKTLKKIEILQVKDVYILYKLYFREGIVSYENLYKDRRYSIDSHNFICFYHGDYDDFYEKYQDKPLTNDDGKLSNFLKNWILKDGKIEYTTFAKYVVMKV